MANLLTSNLKEQQSINELERKIQQQKDKLNKKLTRQKVLLGAFLVDALEHDRVDGLKEFVAKELPNYLTRKGDKELMEDLIVKLGGAMPAEDEAKQEQVETSYTAPDNNNEFGF